MRFVFFDSFAEDNLFGAPAPGKMIGIAFEGAALVEGGFDVDFSKLASSLTAATLVCGRSEDLDILYGLCKKLLRYDMAEEFIETEAEALLAFWSLPKDNKAVAAFDFGGDTCSMLLHEMAMDDVEEGVDHKVVHLDNQSISCLSLALQEVGLTETPKPSG